MNGTNAIGEPFSFRTWPFFWMTQVGGGYLKTMEAELKPLGLDIPTWRVLMILHEDKCLSVSDIAGYATTKLSTMTRMIQRMQADELVVARVSTTDRRVTEVLLTDRGNDAINLAWTAASRVYRQAFRGMTKRRVALLNTLLKEVAANLR